MATKTKKYPEHAKLEEVQEESQSIGEFLDWLQGTHDPPVVLMVRHSDETDEEGEPIYRNADAEIVADWYPPRGFSLSKEDLEMERRQTEEGIDRRLVQDPEGKHLFPLTTNVQDLLAKFFSIDRDKLEQEKRAMLSAMRSASA